MPFHWSWDGVSARDFCCYESSAWLWERNGHSWKFMDRHSEDPLSKNGNGNYPSRDRKYDGKHRLKFPMIYYTTATSRNRTRQLKFLVFCSGKELFLPTKIIIYPNIIKQKKSTFGVSWKTLVLGLGWCGPHSSKMDRIGTFFPQRNSATADPEDVSHTHPEMMTSHLCKNSGLLASKFLGQ